MKQINKYLSSLKIINFVDLFSGIGGFHFAFSEFCKENNYKAKCVLTSEIDKSAIENYSNNFNIGINEIIDIKKIDYNSFEERVDVLFAGFPCQTFSKAGQQLGFLDKVKGTLFFDILKMIDEKLPKIVLLENVKHLINHDEGKTYKIIIDSLKERGYIVNGSPLSISPKQIGIPQDRPRVYIPAIHNSIMKNRNHLDIKVSKKEINENTYKKYLEKKIDDKYLISYDKQMLFSVWGEFVDHFISKGHMIPVIWLDDMLSKNKINPLFPAWKIKHIENMRNFYNIDKIFIDFWFKKNKLIFDQKWKKKLEWQAGLEYSFNKSFIQLRPSGIRCRRPNTFPSLVAMVQIPIIKHKNTWRKLTPRETANLQSFPQHHKITKIDSQAYKQYGNAVNVDVVLEILNNINNL